MGVGVGWGREEDLTATICELPLQNCVAVKHTFAELEQHRKSATDMQSTRLRGYRSTGLQLPVCKVHVRKAGQQ